MNKIFLQPTILLSFSLFFHNVLAQYLYHALPQYPEEWTAHLNIDKIAYNFIYLGTNDQKLGDFEYGVNYLRTDRLSTN